MRSRNDAIRLGPRRRAPTRAAGGAGRRELFETSEKKALSLVTLHQDFAPGVYMSLGEGARALGDWDQAESYAAMALEAARKRKQRLAERDAGYLLDGIAEREPAPREEAPPDPDRIRLLTRRFLARLRKWKAPDPGRPGTDALSNPEDSPRADL